MRVLSAAILMVWLLAGAVQAQVDISGTWQSSTGSEIEIPHADYGPGNLFEILARGADGRLTRYQGVWEAGSPQSFVYETPEGARIVGVVLPDGDTIRVTNPRTGWTALWTRSEACWREPVYSCCR